jgi:hypothetical protein
MIAQFIPPLSCVVTFVHFVWWLRLRAILFVSTAFVRFCL